MSALMHGYEQRKLHKGHGVIKNMYIFNKNIVLILK